MVSVFWNKDVSVRNYFLIVVSFPSLLFKGKIIYIYIYISTNTQGKYILLENLSFSPNPFSPFIMICHSIRRFEKYQSLSHSMENLFNC